MAREIFQSSYDYHASVYQASTGERLPVLAESLTNGDLAQQILVSYSDPDSGEWATRAEWESDDLLCTFNLFEKHNSQGKYYSLDVDELGTTGYSQYVFGHSRTNPVSYDRHDTDDDIPTLSQEELHHRLATYLRDRYQKTERGQAAGQWYAQRFDDITGRFSAGMALSDPHASMHRVEAAASDPEIRRRGIKHLYNIAKQGHMLYSGESAFGRALDKTLEEQRRYRHTQRINTDFTAPLPIVRENPDLPQL